MTATDERPAVTCPDWCEQSECKGEHWQPPDYYAATGREPFVSPETGAVFPVVGVGMDFSELDGDDAPSIALHMTGLGSGGHNVDENVFLRPSEAREIGRALLARADYLEGKRAHPSAPTEPARGQEQ